VPIAPATQSTLARLRQTRGQREAFARRLRRFGPVLLVVFVGAAYHVHPLPGLTGRGLIVSIAVVAFVLGVLGAAATMFQSGRSGVVDGADDEVPVVPSLAHSVFVVILLAGSVALMWVQPRGPGAEGALAAVLFVARLLPGRPVLPVLAAAFVALALFVSSTGQGLAGLAVVAALAGLYAVMFLALRLSEANQQAEQLLIELEHSRAAEADAAVLGERQRLAREMHDVLAHSLSGLLIQLDGARILATENPSDPRLPGVIDRAHRLGKSGLEEARRAIGMLRDNELPGPERLATLAAQFEQQQGIPCQLTVTGEPRQLRSEARLALYRVAQEGLTNITKHAHPQRVDLHLAYESSVARLTVEDFSTTNGSPLAPAADRGYGLTGMRERAELIGGTLTAQTTSRGFRVELNVPT
jgi:signal transduction histidine kinase